MDDALCMGGVESVSDLDADIKQDFHVDRTPHDEVFERLTVEKFHGDESHAILFVNLVDGANVGVVQSRGGLGLTLKTSQCLRVLRHIVRQEFQSYEAVKLDVLSLVHHAHSTAAEL